MRRWIRTLELVTVAVAACLLCNSVTQAKPPQAAYTIIPFMPPNSNSLESIVNGLNEVGQVVGHVKAPDGSRCGLHLDLETGDYTLLNLVPSDINKHNQIVGIDRDLDRGVFWSGPDSGPVTLPPLDPLLEGDVRSTAHLINDAGIICGASYEIIPIEVPPYFEETYKPVAWRVTIDANGVPQVAGPWLMEPPEPPGDGEWLIYDINEVNNDGTAQIVGTYCADGMHGVQREAMIWTVNLNGDGTLTPGDDPPFISLGTLGLEDPSWSEGRNINNVGDVCGQSDDYPCFSLGGNHLQPLAVPPDMHHGSTRGINDFGEIVGWIHFYDKRGRIVLGNNRAYLWRNGNAIDLNKEIGKRSGWDKLHSATYINNAGVIAGYGRFDVYNRGFLLIPK